MRRASDLEFVRGCVLVAIWLASNPRPLSLARRKRGKYGYPEEEGLVTALTGYSMASSRLKERKYYRTGFRNVVYIM